jgi:hypothetical protein
MIINGQHVDIEVQVANKGNYPERSYIYVGEGVFNPHAEKIVALTDNLRAYFQACKWQ